MNSTFYRDFGIPVSRHIEQVKHHMAPLDFSRMRDYSPSETAYFEYYGIHFNNVQHHFGSIISGDNTLACHVFLPPGPAGTVILLHGYYDHTGMVKNLIQYCLNRRLGVATFDLPGHGLSSGERVAANDFCEYHSAFNDFLNVCQKNLMEPFHLIGHSLGCCIAFDYLVMNASNKFEKTIFLAPLIHNAHWNISRTGYFLASRFLKNIPRRSGRNSTNPDFNRLINDDPLQSRILPSKWLNAFYHWEKRIKAVPPVAHPVLLIQGTSDDIVDWKYNILFLQKKIKNLQIRMINNAGHHLINESLHIQKQVFQTIDNCFVPDNY